MKVSKIVLKFTLLLIIVFLVGCETNEIENSIDANIIAEKSAQEYYGKMQQLSNIDQENLKSYLENTAKNFINEMDLPKKRKTQLLNLKGNQIVNEAANLYFEITEEGTMKLLRNKFNHKVT